MRIDAVLRLRFRATLKRLVHPPAPPSPDELPAPAAATARDAVQMRRRWNVTTLLREAMARQLAEHARETP